MKSESMTARWKSVVTMQSEMKKERRERGWRARRTASGFTLLELMVAIMVASLVVLAAYQIFATTSEGMYEASSLADTTDRARYALELLARDVQAAGSYGTPNASTDPFVHPTQLTGRNVRAIYALTENDHQGSSVSQFQEDWNRATRSDEIILLGAYDFPFPIEIAFPGGGTTFLSARATNTERGTLRFLDIDPFVTTPQTVTDIGPLVNSVLGPLGATTFVTSRLLRVVDRNGFAQFATINNGGYSPGAGVDKGLTLDLDGGTNALQARVGEEGAGLEPAGADDVAYQATFLDAYRYRVCAPRETPNRLRLVKERLDASQLIANVEPPVADLCEDVPTGAGNIVISRTLIVDRVVDFQIWYDCIPPGNTQMAAADWASTWMAPDASSGPLHDCMYADINGNNVGAAGPENARMVHIRLSVHTENQRSDVPNYGFLTELGDTVNDTASLNAANYVNVQAAPAVGDLPGNPIGHLQTADLDGDASTAARVVTMQVDVELRNFIYSAHRAAPQLVDSSFFQ